MIRIGTRGSLLATTQAGTIRDELISRGHPAELVIISTDGDRSAAPVAEMPVAEAPPNPEAPPAVPGGESVPGATTEAPPKNTNEVATVTMLCRGVDLTSVSASANTELAFAVLKDLQTSPLLDAEGTQFEGNIDLDATTGTFTFGITLKLKEPLRLY